MPAIAPEELLRQLEGLDQNTIASLPDNLRVRFYHATRKFHLALESPTELIARVLLTQPTEAIHLRVATDIHLFTTLKARALTIPEIAEATGAQPRLLYYLLRGLGAYGVVLKDEQHRFTAASKCALLQNETFENAFPGCQDFMEKIVGSWPAYLRSVNYQCPTEASDTAVQYALGTKGMSFRETFQHSATAAELLKPISVLMSTWAEGFIQLQNLYPVRERLETGFDPGTAMFVDVGGNFGQKALALKKAYPTLPGRFVVQDLPHVIANAPKNDPLYKDIEMTAHDFFTEQPVQGARCYYIRQTLHDWHDADAVKVLRRLRDACTPGYSRVLVHEIIVRETDMEPWVAAQDLNMLSMFAISERTEADWRRVCDEAGLKLLRIYTDDNAYCEGIIEMGI